MVVGRRAADVSDDEEAGRSYLPWIMAALVLVVGGAKLDAARPLVARGIAVALPIVPVVMAIKRLEGGKITLERAGTAVGWVTMLAGELCVVVGLFNVSALSWLLPVAHAALYAAVASALVVHTLEARRGTKGRFAGFIGIAAAFAIYISTHGGKDAFGSVFGGFFVAMACGGAALLIGELLARVFKKA
jgi:hypothetical protein